MSDIEAKSGNPRGDTKIESFVKLYLDVRVYTLRMCTCGLSHRSQYTNPKGL